MKKNPTFSMSFKDICVYFYTMTQFYFQGKFFSLKDLVCIFLGSWIDAQTLSNTGWSVCVFYERMRIIDN